MIDAHEYAEQSRQFETEALTHLDRVISESPLSALDALKALQASIVDTSNGMLEVNALDLRIRLGRILAREYAG